MKALLIAEKPLLMKDIQAVYNKMSGFKDEITFMSLRGHILELQSPEEYSEAWGTPWKIEQLPMIPEQFKYKVRSDCKPLFRDIKEAINSGKYDYIINACDAAREGELIFFSVYRTIGTKIPVKRFWASDTTDETIEKALNNLIDDKDRSLTLLKASAQYRAYFDWLMGMNLSRAISIKTKTLIPVGRVMTPTLAIIVQRELEILNFKPTDFWEIEADFEKYKGMWFDPETNETKILNKAKADKIKNTLSKTGKIESVDKKREKNFAPTLHSLLELQKDANKYYGYTADRTLEIAQVLYEKKKVLSYPRTDSRYLPKNMASIVPKHLNAIQDIPGVGIYVDKILGDSKKMNDTLSTKKYVDDKKVTDHHAIIPTAKKPNLSDLNKEELNVYMLVVKRFISIFLDPYVVDKTTIITKVDNEVFKTIGKLIIDLGYMELYKKDKSEADKEDGKDDVIAPVKKGEEVNVKALKLLTKKTTPPQRYDDSSLLQAMQGAGKFVEEEELKNILKETAGLGTSATRAEIIKKLVGRKMISRKGKLIYASDFGVQVIQTLNGRDIASPALSAKWEMKLTDMEDDKYEPKKFFNEMLEYTKEVTKDILDNIGQTVSNNSDKEILGKCPKCQASVIEGKNFYLCSNYKKSCDFIVGKEVFGAKMPKTEIKKLLTGKETKEMEFTLKSGDKVNRKLMLKEGKLIFINPNGKPSTSGASKNGANGSSDFKPSGKLLGKCPKCESQVIEGKDFYNCQEYNKSCDFSLKKEIKGGLLGEKDIEDLLKGVPTRDIDFVWGNGKPGKARLRFVGEKLDFMFCN